MMPPGFLPFISADQPGESWKGIDKTVIEKIAAEAGHPAREPYINTDHGDLLLCLFLLAGAVGGFIGGYAFRGLFPPKNASNLKSKI
jgi:cobalt/nickel transport protein